jgi:hypothetical protein
LRVPTVTFYVGISKSELTTYFPKVEIRIQSFYRDSQSLLASAEEVNVI